MQGSEPELALRIALVWLTVPFILLIIVDDSLRVASCFDEDPINDYYRKGYVQIAAKRYFDFCQGDYLREYVCSGNRKEIADQFNCEFGCENGACLRISTYS